jgi:hypothetical protein
MGPTFRLVAPFYIMHSYLLKLHKETSIKKHINEATILVKLNRWRIIITGTGWSKKAIILWINRMIKESNHGSFSGILNTSTISWYWLLKIERDLIILVTLIYSKSMGRRYNYILERYERKLKDKETIWPLPCNFK